ncbi:nucleotidyltransferase family protein [Legionella waltersii]|uniref:Mannose-1-phosphate guanyltransferase n=1 Tax=Legionella waltersii TaxID=66969 RepID=A0A0W1ADK6_9GAMM|nr:nucleotidyltransferase family protein [Legionella waltersii]KTD79400.1 mannose-1-phosphate guanyltransferase [Legionella waltersii]SNU97870.1 mannose-1-phosphate guanylyltransferase [Legionella waltersii]
MKTAMILAAGRGERLLPLTETVPKCLCLVKGKPLIEHHIINLARAGFERLIINHAYLGGKIRQFAGNGEQWGVDIVYSPEPPGGLETGGGIVNALPLFANRPFITVNADIYTDYDFLQIPFETVNTVHLVLIPRNPKLLHHGDFGLESNGIVSNCSNEYTFSGIAAYHPNIFSQCMQGRYSVAPLIRSYVDQHLATGSRHYGFWFDIGSMDRLAAANAYS